MDKKVKKNKINDEFEKIMIHTEKLLNSHKGSHGWDHTLRVLHLAEHIAKKEKSDLETIRYAALLHDIGRSIEDKSGGKICHAEAGAFLTEEILEKHTSLTKSQIKSIIHCIKTHRYRNKNTPETLEAKILYDADKLDSIGATGIARAYLFSGEIGARLHNTDITSIEDTKPYSEDDTGYREYMIKLRYIKDNMLTDEGKRLAQERHAFMEQFFDRLNKEINGNI